LLGRLRLVVALIAVSLRDARIAVSVPVGLALRHIRLLLLLPAHLWALRHQDAVIVFGVLEIVLLHHAVSGRAGIARKLEILLIHMCGGATNLDIGTCGVERPIVSVVVTVLRPAAASA
jgi:hypothetical protein